MQKAEAQHNQMQSQPAVRQGKGMVFDSPQGEQIAQLEAMAERSPQVAKQAQLVAMLNNSSRMSAQRKAINDIHNSPSLTAQRRHLDSFAGVTAQNAQVPIQSGAPMQFGGRDGDEWDPGPGQGEQAPPTPRPGQGGQERPASTGSESSVQDGYSPRAGEERDETAQLMAAGEVSQLKVAQCTDAPVKPNNTGLPDNLKSGIESLSGMSMDSVRVHYNSSQPAQLNALAYAQGTDIHVAPGQEQHLPHEAWHVVQQAQGRVRPTMQMKDGVPVNDDAGLEHEADVMGGRAASLGVMQGKPVESAIDLPDDALQSSQQPSAMQRQGIAQLESKYSNTGQQYSYVSSLDNKAKTAEVGLTMEAWLDPDEIRGGQPSTDNSSQNEMMVSIRKHYGLESTPGYVVKGHLLNEHIGGLADGDNLYPISMNANGVHSKTVETIAKKLVNSQPLYYKVSVMGTSDMGSATAIFGTELREWDKKKDFKTNGNLIMNPPIYSDLGSPVGKQNSGMNVDAFDQRDEAKENYY